MTRLMRDIATQPLGWIALMLLVALWRTGRSGLNGGRCWVTSAFFLLVLIDWLPSPQKLMHDWRDPPDWILAGWRTMPAALALARAHPELRMVFTGGCAGPDGCLTESALNNSQAVDLQCISG